MQFQIAVILFVAISGTWVLSEATNDPQAHLADSQLISLVKTLQSQVSTLEALVKSGFSKTCKSHAKNCLDHKNTGRNVSGVYTIYPGSGDPIKVYCDMTTDGGGWLVIQHRSDGSETFYRSFHDYEVGFGNLTGEHWIGNKNIHDITSQCTYQLKVVLTDFQNVTKTADYSQFSVGDQKSRYTLHVSGYSGDAGDSLSFDHNGHPFSTADADSDGSKTVNCAQQHKGGYWYSNCFKSNINGEWGKPGNTGIIWGSFKSWQMYVLKGTTMMIRPVNCD